MAKLILLRGNSGSGKSFTARALQRRIGRNTLLIPQDTVRRDMLYARDGMDTAALPLLQALLAYGHAHCEVTILEGILNAQWYAPLFREAMRLYGSDIHAYYYDLSFEETLRRHATRAESGEFGAAEMRRWWKGKDYIGFLPETPLTAEMGPEETVERILRGAGIVTDDGGA